MRPWLMRVQQGRLSRNELAENTSCPFLCYEPIRQTRHHPVNAIDRQPMHDLQHIRTAKPPAYPDQSVYAEFACGVFGLSYRDIEGGTGLAFRVTSSARSVAFGGGRCSFYPQNSATASTLANDKYLCNTVLEDAGVRSLGGHYFFLHDRHRAHRPEGHERADAFACFRALGGHAFVKPLTGSRGDFAQAVHDEGALADYLDAVSQHSDSILMQRIFVGSEYRLFLLDDQILYSVRKLPPHLVGDGITPLRALLTARAQDLLAQGISTAITPATELDRVLAIGEHRELPGRMNRSAGGAMVFESPRLKERAEAQARAAARALGLRVAAVDLFTDLDGDPDAIGMIEVNANPSIRFLEDSGRSDLILAIWRHTFAATGLLDV